MYMAKRMIVITVCFLSLGGWIESSSCSAEIVNGEIGRRIDAYLTRITPFGFSGAALLARNGEILLNKPLVEAELLAE